MAFSSFWEIRSSLLVECSAIIVTFLRKYFLTSNDCDNSNNCGYCDTCLFISDRTGNPEKDIEEGQRGGKYEIDREEKEGEIDKRGRR